MHPLPGEFRRALILAATISILCSTWMEAASVNSAPPLPAPAGSVVNVSTEAQLQSAVSAAAPGSTIVIAPGTYVLTSTLWVSGVDDLTIRGATDSRDDVVLVGKGLTNPDYGAVQFGIWSNSQRTTIANLTIRDTYSHPIIFNAGAESPRVYNVRLVNTGDQFIKANPDGAGGGVDNGIVEYTVMEYTTTARDSYTNGVDVHTGRNWIVRNNLFRNITTPSGQLAGPAVLIWNHSSGAVVEGNTFINCQREISMGLQQVTYDNTGGVVRNNFVYRAAGLVADVAVLVADSPNTQVLHNTMLLSGTYPNAVEYRFTGTTGVVIANNLASGAIQARDGATGTVTGNHLSATPGLFVNPAAGDLHLLAGATAVMDKVPSLANAIVDWDGNARPQGSAADYGADEYLSNAPANQPPTISLTNPAAGATFAAPATIGIDASASDLDGTIARVDFYANSTLVGSAVSAPYSVAYTNVPAGTYALKAIAFDNSGASTQSASLSVTVGAASPGGLPAPWYTQDIGAPLIVGSASFSNGAFTVKGAGVDIGGASDQFRFVYQTLAGDGQVTALVGSVNRPNFGAKAGVMIRSTLAANSENAFVYLSSSKGTAFTRRAAAGATTTSTAGPPRVAAPYWVRLTRAGSVFTAYVSSDGATWWLIGSDSISMGATVYVGMAVTSHTTLVAATATFSNVAVSGALQPVNVPPVVTLTAPANGAKYTAPASMTISATASDPDGTVAKVSFYNGAQLIGSATTSPYAVTWSNVTAGSYGLTAVAVDDKGASSTSTAVSISVAAANQPPVVLLSAPSGGSSFVAPATIGVSAVASDADGTVTSVSFYAGAQLIGAVNVAPFSVDWTNVTVGTYTLTAVAFDNAGASTTSPPVSVTVSAASSGGVAVDKLVSVDATGTAVTPPLSTTTGGDLLVAFLGSDGPLGQVQSATVTGAGLTWSLVARSNTQAGVSEIWTAVAPSPLVNATVSASLAYTGYHSSLTVVAFAGAAGVGASSTAGGGSGAPAITLTPTKVGSAVYAAGNDWDRALARVVGVGQVMAHQWVDSSVGDTFWVQALSSPIATAGVPVQLNDAAPTSDRWNLTAVEIVPGAPPTSPPTSPPPPPPPPPSSAPTQVVFTPSADDATNVTYYQLDVFQAGADPAASAPVATANLGKPPIVNNAMTADVAALIAALPTGSYVTTVTAVGVGGATRSAPSNTFTR